MVPRLCGYLDASRQLLVQPIGQHKMTSDAVGRYDISGEHLSGARRADTYAASVVRWNKYMTDQDSDSSDLGSAID